MNHVKEFERRCEEKRKRGLVDMKFVTGDLSGATMESFCREANAIDEAIERGDIEDFSFNDSYRDKVIAAG